MNTNGIRSSCYKSLESTYMQSCSQDHCVLGVSVSGCLPSAVVLGCLPSAVVLGCLPSAVVLGCLPRAAAKELQVGMYCGVVLWYSS